MGKLILFYKYVHIQYPKQIVKWQHKLCTQLGLKGRVIIAQEGINATLGGEDARIDTYMQLLNEHELFGGIDFKQCQGSADHFPRLRIVAKDEIVKFGIDTRKITALMAGKRLTPTQTHELLLNKPENLVILDTRNLYESRIGTFKDAIIPEINHFRQLPEYLDANEHIFKDKTVLMFCTGGVRCERASAYLKEKNISQEVFHMEGGIQRYVETYPDGFFRGKNYVFDGRIAVKVNDDILGSCLLCQKPCDDYTNCQNASCNKHFIGCAPCITLYKNACSVQCNTLLENNLVAPRPLFKKVSDQSSCTL